MKVDILKADSGVYDEGHRVYSDANKPTVLGTTEYDSISISDHGGHAWFRNNSLNWTFQSGSTSDDWTRTFTLHLPSPTTSGQNDQWAYLGQRNANVPNGTYKGVYITKRINSGTGRGDLLAGYSNFTSMDISGVINSACETPTEYSFQRLPTYARNSKTYLRKFRGGISDTIWHETVQDGSYRLATGDSDSSEVLKLTSGGGGYINGHQIYTTGFKPTAADVGAVSLATGDGRWAKLNDVYSKAHSDNTYLDKKKWLKDRRVNDCNLPATSGKDAISLYHFERDASNRPSGLVHGDGNIITQQFGDNYFATQIATDWYSPSMWVRNKNNTTWSSWARVYTTSYKPSWADVGGNTYVKDNGGHWQVGSSRWLRAGSNSTGFLPATSGTTGQSFIGTSDWWFNSSYVANSYTKKIKLSDIDLIQSSSSGSLSVSGSGGNIEIGPKNSSYCHIYTDRPSFYFNKELYTNNHRVYHTGYKPTASVIGALGTDGGRMGGTYTIAGNFNFDAMGGATAGETGEIMFNNPAAPSQEFNPAWVNKMNKLGTYGYEYENKLSGKTFLNHTGSYTWCNISRVGDYRHIANVCIPTNGYTATITLWGGEGFNVGAYYQLLKTEIRMRSGNGSGGNNDLNLMCLFEDDSRGVFDEICYVGKGNDWYEIWGKSQAGYASNLAWEAVSSNGVILHNVLGEDIYSTTRPSGAQVGKIGYLASYYEGRYRSGEYNNFFPYIAGDGVMEVGKYIDFHEPGSSADFDTRLYAQNNELLCTSYLNVNRGLKLRYNDTTFNMRIWDGGSTRGKVWEMTRPDGTSYSMYFDTTGSKLQLSGTGYASGGWNTGSDERFKENVTPYRSTYSNGHTALSTLGSINTYNFNYKGDDKIKYGFIAQYVENILPEAVTTLSIIDPDHESVEGEKPEDKPTVERKFIDPMALIALQGEALKELHIELEELRYELSTIKRLLGAK